MMSPLYLAFIEYDGQLYIPGFPGTIFQVNPDGKRPNPVLHSLGL